MVGLQTVSSLERCPLFGVSFIEKFPLFCAFSLICGACWLEAVFGCDSLSSHLSFHSYLPSHLPSPPLLSPPLPPLPSLSSLSVQFALLSSSQEVRAGGLRVLRYILVTKEIFQVMLDHCIDQLVVRYSRAGPLRAFRQLLHASNGKALSLLIRFFLSE